MEALAAILVQGGEVIAAAYTPDSGAVLITDVATANIQSELDMATGHPVPVDMDNVILVESESRLYPLDITAISKKRNHRHTPPRILITSGLWKRARIFGKSSRTDISGLVR